MSETANKAVFLSYASQDAEAAKRIADAFRAAGVEVWFDQSELVGGDAWDAKIRKQIAECALFVPLISAATQARREGYFRLEWRIAAQRTHMMSESIAFLLPVVIDATRDAEADVPAEFRAVQWTKLPGGETPEKFRERVKTLLGGGPSSRATAPSAPASRELGPPGKKPSRRWLGPALLGAVGVAALALWQPRKRPTSPTPPGDAPVAAVAGRSASRADVEHLLTRVRKLTNQTDVMRTELDTASDLLGQAAKLDPTDASLWAEWALLDRRYIREDMDNSAARRDAARRHAAQATSLDPGQPVVRLAQALVMLLLGDDPATKQTAVKILEPLLAEIPEDGRVPVEIGWTVFDPKSPEAALGWFDRAARIPGEAGRAHFARASALWRSGDMGRGLAEIDLALAAERANHFLLDKSYLLTIWEGDVVTAKQVLAGIPSQYFVEDFPAAARYFVAMRGREYDQAVAALRAVPHDYLEGVALVGPAGYYTGYALARAGKAAAAQLEWRSALALVEGRLAAKPTDRLLMQFKALLLSSLGESEKAGQAWQAQRELHGEVAADNWMEQSLSMQLLPPAQAFDWLARKVAEGSRYATAAQLRLDPTYDPVRADPRFPALLAKAEADPRLSPAAAKGALPSAPALATSDQKSAPADKSVAVLAFANLSDDKGNEYFSDGISEELLNVLAKIPGLKVSARTSSFHFKGKDTAIAEIAQKLGVAYVVEGSVRKAGDKVRITAQLIKAADGFHVWSDTFTRDLKDIFAMQDEIAGLIAQNLKLGMGLMAPGTRRAVNPEAHQLVLEGRHFWNLRTPEGFDRAEAAFTKAITLDPQFAQAYAGLADVRWVRTVFASYAGANFRPTPGAGTETERALALDPTLAEAYPAAGGALQWSGRLPEAEQVFKKAIALNPNYALAHHWYSLVLESQGRLDEALAEIGQAIQLDPLSVAALTTRHRYLLMAGRISAALAADEKAQALRPGFNFGAGLRVQGLLAAGQRDEALAAARAIVAHQSLESRYVSDASAVYVLRKLGHGAEAEAHVANLLPRLPADSYLRGLALAALDRWDEAMPYLERTPTGMCEVFFWNPVWDPWRDDPRFSRLLAKLNCTEEYKVARATLKRMRQEQEVKR